MEGWETTACFDVFAWHENEILFCEAKEARKDRLTRGQEKFIEGALICGVSPDQNAHRRVDPQSTQSTLLPIAYAHNQTYQILAIASTPGGPRIRWIRKGNRNSSQSGREITIPRRSSPAAYRAAFRPPGHQDHQIQHRRQWFRKIRAYAGLKKIVTPHILRHNAPFQRLPHQPHQEAPGLETTCRYYLGVDKAVAKKPEEVLPLLHRASGRCPVYARKQLPDWELSLIPLLSSLRTRRHIGSGALTSLPSLR